MRPLAQTDGSRTKYPLGAGRQSQYVASYGSRWKEFHARGAFCRGDWNARAPVDRLHKFLQQKELCRPPSVRPGNRQGAERLVAYALHKQVNSMPRRRGRGMNRPSLFLYKPPPFVLQ